MLRKHGCKVQKPSSDARPSSVSLFQQAEDAVAFLQSYVIEAAFNKRPGAGCLQGFKVLPQLSEKAIGMGDAWPSCQAPSMLGCEQPYHKQMQRLYDLLYWASGDLACCRTISEFELDVPSLVAKMRCKPESPHGAVYMCLHHVPSLLALCQIWQPLAILRSVWTHHQNQAVAQQLFTEFVEQQMLLPTKAMSQLCEAAAIHVSSPASTWGIIVTPHIGKGGAVTAWVEQLLVDAAVMQHYALLIANPVKVYDVLVQRQHPEAAVIYEFFRLEHRCVASRHTGPQPTASTAVDTS